MTADARLVMEGLLGQVSDLRAELTEIAHGPDASAAATGVGAAPALPEEALLEIPQGREVTDELLLSDPLPIPGGSDEGGET